MKQWAGSHTQHGIHIESEVKSNKKKKQKVKANFPYFSWVLVGWISCDIVHTIHILSRCTAIRCINDSSFLRQFATWKFPIKLIMKWKKHIFWQCYLLSISIASPHGKTIQFIILGQQRHTTVIHGRDITNVFHTIILTLAFFTALFSHSLAHNMYRSARWKRAD